MSNDESAIRVQASGPRRLLCSHRPVGGFPTNRCLCEKRHGDTAPWLQALHVISWFAALRGLRGFHVFGVFTEARFAIAPGAVMERLLCFGHIRLFAFPGFQDRSL